MSKSFNSFNMQELQDAMNKASLAEDLVQMARTAENCERYEDMCCYIRLRVEAFPQTPLSAEERNLLSVAYKNVIGARRASWRALTGELTVAPEGTQKALQEYKMMVEEELKVISADILTLLENVLIKNTSQEITSVNCEEKVFYLKMAGDYYRYLTESVGGDENKQNTEKFYSEAFEVAKNLDATHPIRLGLALNFSVCKFEILHKKEDACEMAKDAFDEAISKLDRLAENDYKDSTLIMQLLRDNLTLWTSNNADNGDDNVDDVIT